MRHATLDQRAHAARAAGFDGIGLFIGTYMAAVRNGITNDLLLEVLDRHDTRVLELEALPLFQDDLLDIMVGVAEHFGVRRIQTVAPFTGDVDRVAAGAWLRAAADRVAPFNTSLAIEFLPFTSIATASDASELIERAHRPNVGMCIDSWHVFRGGGLDSLANLDAEHVVSIQLNDGPLQAVLEDYVDDCLHHREVMGDGEFDLGALMALLPSGLPLSIEVPDDDLDLLAPDVVAQRLAAATHRLVR
jgi:sugar phosphate isomerase/epimerase